MLLCPVHEKARGTRGIEDCILGHKEAALQSVTKIRLTLLQALRIQDLGGNSAISVEIVLARYLAHLLFISCNPDRAALVILDVRGQFVPEKLPEFLRVPGEGELRLGIVHHDYVSHAGASGAAAHNFAINHGDPQAAAGELVRTGRAYNSGAHYHHVISCVAHGFSLAMLISN